MQRCVPRVRLNVETLLVQVDDEGYVSEEHLSVSGEVASRERDLRKRSMTGSYCSGHNTVKTVRRNSANKAPALLASYPNSSFLSVTERRINE